MQLVAITTVNMISLTLLVSLLQISELWLLDWSVEASGSILLASVFESAVSVLTLGHWLRELLHDISDILLDLSI